MCEYSIKLNAYLQAAAIRSSTVAYTSLLRLLQHILLRFLHPPGGKHVFRSSNGTPWLVRAFAFGRITSIIANDFANESSHRINEPRRIEFRKVLENLRGQSNK